MKDNKWSFKPLSALCSINLGNTPSRSKSEYWGKGYPWVSISDLKEKYISKTKEEITDIALTESNCKIVKNGTLLMSFKLSIGKLAFAETDLYTNEAIVALPIKDESELLKEYLYYVLKSIPLVGGNQAAMGQTLNKQSLSVLQIPLPPTLDDQKRIAKVLSQCEKLIQKRKESIHLLDEFVKSTFRNMFEVYEEMFFSKPELLGDNIAYLTSGSRGWARYYSDKGAKFLRIQNVGDGVIRTDNLIYVNAPDSAESERTRVLEGDLLISITADLGRTSVVPKDFGEAYINQHLALVRLNSNINATYAAYFYNMPFGNRAIQKKNRAAVKAGLNFNDIRSFPIIIPPLKLQNEFAKIVEKKEIIKKKFKENLKELENLYGSISQRAFNGELDLSKVDISDMENSKKKDFEEVKDITVEEDTEYLKKKVQLVNIIEKTKDNDFYQSETCQVYIDKSKVLRTEIYSYEKKKELIIDDYREELFELNSIGKILQMEIEKYTPWQIDQHKSIERYILLLPENILNEYPNINVFSRKHFDYSSMTLDDYYGIPDEIVAKHGSIENHTMDLEFFFKKYFSNRSFTIEDLEELYNQVVYERGDWFKYEEIKTFIFNALEGDDALLAQTFEEIEIQSKEAIPKKVTKKIMLKVI